MSISRKEYKTTLEPNSYVTPFTHTGYFEFPVEDIENYGDPISIYAKQGNNSPVPVHNYNKAEGVQISSYGSEVIIYVVYLKIA